MLGGMSPPHLYTVIYRPPPLLYPVTDIHTLTVVNSGDKRKMSYPPSAALLVPITL